MKKNNDLLEGHYIKRERLYREIFTTIRNSPKASPVRKFKVVTQVI